MILLFFGGVGAGVTIPDAVVTVPDVHKQLFKYNNSPGLKYNQLSKLSITTAGLNQSLRGTTSTARLLTESSKCILRSHASLLCSMNTMTPRYESDAIELMSLYAQSQTLCCPIPPTPAHDLE